MRRRTAATIAVAGLVFGLLVVRNLWVLRTPVFAEGDFGSNSIRIDYAKHFEQLVGHYSRLGFDHPGPAYFYVQAWFEWLFHDVLPLAPEAYNAQLLGILFLNAALIGIGAAIVALRTRSRLNAVLFVGIVIVVVSAESGTVGQPGHLLTSNWPPHASVVPFLVFLVAGASVLSGRFESLWVYVLTSALLVHGLVTFVAFVIPISCVVGAWIWWTSRRDRVRGRDRRRTLVLTGIVVAVFALPILLETVVNWPGQIPDYWRYAFASDRPHHSLEDGVRYVLTFWWRGRPRVGALVFVAAFVAAVALTLRQRDERTRRFSGGLLVMNGLATACALNYAVNGVDLLQYRYVSFFYLSVPATTYTVIAINVAAFVRGSRLRSQLRPVVLVGALALTVAAVAAPGLSNDYRGDPTIDEMVDRLQRDPRRDGRVVALEFGVHQSANATGLVDRGLRAGVPMCVATEEFAHLVPDASTCGAEPQWRVAIVPLDDRGPGDRIVTGAGSALVDRDGTRTGGRLTTPPGHLAFD
jgi:hypothetical protein